MDLKQLLPAAKIKHSAFIFLTIPLLVVALFACTSDLVFTAPFSLFLSLKDCFLSFFTSSPFYYFLLNFIIITLVFISGILNASNPGKDGEDTQYNRDLLNNNYMIISDTIHERLLLGDLPASESSYVNTLFEVSHFAIQDLRNVSASQNVDSMTMENLNADSHSSQLDEGLPARGQKSWSGSPSSEDREEETTRSEPVHASKCQEGHVGVEERPVKDRDGSMVPAALMPENAKESARFRRDEKEARMDGKEDGDGGEMSGKNVDDADVKEGNQWEREPCTKESSVEEVGMGSEAEAEAEAGGSQGHGHSFVHLSRFGHGGNSIGVNSEEPNDPPLLLVVQEEEEEEEEGSRTLPSSSSSDCDDNAGFALPNLLTFFPSLSNIQRPHHTPLLSDDNHTHATRLHFSHLYRHNVFHTSHDSVLEELDETLGSDRMKPCEIPVDSHQGMKLNMDHNVVMKSNADNAPHEPKGNNRATYDGPNDLSLEGVDQDMCSDEFNRRVSTFIANFRRGFLEQTNNVEDMGDKQNEMSADELNARASAFISNFHKKLKEFNTVSNE